MVVVRGNRRQGPGRWLLVGLMLAVIGGCGGGSGGGQSGGGPVGGGGAEDGESGDGTGEDEGSGDDESDGGTGDDEGGGDSGPIAAPTAPAPTLTVEAIKTFRFSWPDVDDEEVYRLREDPDGVSGYVEVASLPADTGSYDHEVFLPGRVNARYIVQACNAAGCGDSAPLHPVEVLDRGPGYFKSLFPDDVDWFGRAVAMSADGSVLAIGVPNEDSGKDQPGGDNSLENSGAVYVYTHDSATGDWSPVIVKAVHEPGAGDRFGWSVDLADDGNVLVVGAPFEDSDATGVNNSAREANNLAGGSGAAYIFERAGPGFSFRRRAYLKATNTESGDGFGWSVAISGDASTVAVGARWEDGGASGVNMPDNNTAPRSGAAYVYTDTPDGWSHQAYVKPSNTWEVEHFGEAVALSGDGNVMVVGAPREDSGTTDSGAAYVFERTGSEWRQDAYIKPTGDGIQFSGFAVDLATDGNRLVIGAPFSSGGGRAYTFTRPAAGDPWSSDPVITGSDTAAPDEFGYAVALSGDDPTLLAIGARNQAGRGATYTYRSPGAGLAWTQQTKVTASNSDPDDRFGHALSFSRDGGALAVGAYQEDSDATFVGRDASNNDSKDSGAVYLY